MWIVKRAASIDRKRLLRRTGSTAALLLMLATLSHFVFFPLPVERLQRPHGTFVYSREGEILNAFTSPDQFWRRPVKLSELPPKLVQSVIEIEDRWFYFHPGVNPVSLLLAGIDNMRAGKIVRGGSTITMQVARLMEPKERTFAGKLVEIGRALQLEFAYSKDEILEFYLNLAPYGGNIEGVGAAAYLYFGKQPNQLSLGEMALVIALPASPNRFRPDRNDETPTRRRDEMLRRLQARAVISIEELQFAVQEELPRRRITSPIAAPHFCQMIRAEYPEQSVVTSTIDYTLQRDCERMATLYQQKLSDLGIHNLAVVVIDNQTRELRAMIGSADFGDRTHQGQINGATSPRSPGSALKPFIYGLALEEGLISLSTRIEDLPTNYAGYIPKNYDGEYHGVVAARDALIESLNVPAVYLTSKVGLRPFHSFLQSAGIRALTKPTHQYGLPMILGACEVELIELTNVYASLGREGWYRPLHYNAAHTQSTDSVQLLQPATCYLLSETLSQLKRPDLPTSWEFAEGMPKIAWKTGTSFGRKDAWAIGYNPEYTVGVWAGNFTAEGSIAIVGAEIAAPFMIDLFNHLASGSAAPWFNPPDDIAARFVCAATGLLPSSACHDTISEMYDINHAQNRICQVHRDEMVDAKTGYSLCNFCVAEKEVNHQASEHWPPKIAAWLSRQGVVSLRRGHNPECTGVLAGTGPQISSPEHQAVYYFETDRPAQFQQILFEASPSQDTKQLHWFVDGKLIATSGNSDVNNLSNEYKRSEMSANSRPMSAVRLFYPPEVGTHTLMCVDDLGRSSKITFRVVES